MSLQSLIVISGVLHFGTLLASAAVPQVLDWRRELGKLDRLTRQLVWVHGLFIVLVIIGFGSLSLFWPAELASQTPLARAVCGLIALFWAARLVIQFFVFDAKPYLKNWLLRAGYYSLTMVFIYQTAVMSWAAGM